jgi:hypothetical protein
LAVGRLYGPVGEFYGRERGLTGGGELSRGFIRGRELGILDGRGRELYGLVGRLGGFSG